VGAFENLNVAFVAWSSQKRTLLYDISILLNLCTCQHKYRQKVLHFASYFLNIN
jgi:hypothetical protein